jgi:hypothetical protein
MSQQLKRWESPREQGRNTKGKGGSARARQLRKQQKLLLKKLKANPLNSADTLPNSNPKSENKRSNKIEQNKNRTKQKRKKTIELLPFLLGVFIRNNPENPHSLEEG